MNPYIERDAVWSDFHFGFINAMRRALVPQVQPEFYVKIDAHIFALSGDEGRRLIGRPDVSLARRATDDRTEGTVALLDAPIRLRLPEPAFEERVLFLQVFDSEDHSLVTVIELLSPTNKNKKKDRDQFIGKREDILQSSVHYVEIDLLRGGLRMPLEEMPACDYYVLVSAADDRPDVGFRPISLREPLPTIPIPMPESKSNVRLPLQELLHQAYDEAGYAGRIYSGSPQPRLHGNDAKWARQLAANAS